MKCVVFDLDGTLAESKQPIASSMVERLKRMRQERIRAIAEDPPAPTDVMSTFAQILNDELFHERAFREMAGPKGVELTLEAHREGHRALGLVP